MSKLIIILIKVYQRTLSRMWGPNCRFTPSCSHYTVGAIQHHGAIKGSTMGFRRILKCHPWHEGGYDPVPGVDEVVELRSDESSLSGEQA